jgi:hypothetical protein
MGIVEVEVTRLGECAEPPVNGGSINEAKKPDNRLMALRADRLVKFTTDSEANLVTAEDEAWRRMVDKEKRTEEQKKAS